MRMLKAAFLASIALLAIHGPAFASEGIGGAVDPAIYRLMVFVMAIFVGYYVVWSVTPTPDWRPMTPR